MSDEEDGPMTADVWDVIVVGGGYAGVTAVNRLPEGTRVLLVDPKDDFVHRVRLHEVAAGGSPRVSVPFGRMVPPQAERRRGSVTSVEPGSVRLAGGGELRARHVLVTAGSDQAVPDAITSREAAMATRDQIARATPGTHVAVRGAGLTGIELAAELAFRRPRLVVHLHGRSPVGAGLPGKARDQLRKALSRLGVILDDDASPATALTVEATGLRVSALARDSGLAVDDQGRMRVTPALEAAPGVWGAGDAVVVGDQPHLRASCATAIPMGAHAADNIARALRGEPPAPFDFGYSCRCISLGRRSGLIVRVDALDVPTGRFLAGPPAAVFKSAVCAAVVRAASSFAPRYTWKSANAGPGLAASADRPAR